MAIGKLIKAFILKIALCIGRKGVLFDDDWKDKPYQFYYMPDFPEGKKEPSSHEMDYNLYFNPEKLIYQVAFNGKSWSEWHESGKDTHSTFADPLFIDPEKFDFKVNPNSPALKHGIKSIDIRLVGPRMICGLLSDHMD